jgi:hypothetical protein
MNHTDCQRAQQHLDDLLDGYLPQVEAAATALHIAACGPCAAARQAAEELRAALRQMPSPEPLPGFADAALAAAARRHAPASNAWGKGRERRHAWSAPWQRLEVWAGAAIGAAAAMALMVALWGVPQPGAPLPQPADVRVVMFEPREIGLAIDAGAAMPGATLTVLVEGGIDLVGFGEQRELSWQTDLDAGTNLLALPIIAHSLQDGRLTALVEHGERVQRIDIRIGVDSPPAN